MTPLIYVLLKAQWCMSSNFSSLLLLLSARLYLIKVCKKKKVCKKEYLLDRMDGLLGIMRKVGSHKHIEFNTILQDKIFVNCVLLNNCTFTEQIVRNNIQFSILDSSMPWTPQAIFMIASHNSCRFFLVHIYAVNLLLYQLPKLFY